MVTTGGCSYNGIRSRVGTPRLPNGCEFPCASGQREDHLGCRGEACLALLFAGQEAVLGVSSPVDSMAEADYRTEGGFFSNLVDGRITGQWKVVTDRPHPDPLPVGEGMSCFCGF